MDFPTNRTFTSPNYAFSKVNQWASKNRRRRSHGSSSSPASWYGGRFVTVRFSRAARARHGVSGQTLDMPWVPRVVPSVRRPTRPAVQRRLWRSCIGQRDNWIGFVYYIQAMLQLNRYWCWLDEERRKRECSYHVAQHSCAKHVGTRQLSSKDPSRPA